MSFQNTLILTKRRTVNFSMLLKKIYNPTTLLMLSFFVLLSYLLFSGQFVMSLFAVAVASALYTINKVVSELFFYLDLDFCFNDIIADLDNESSHFKMN